MFLFGLLCMSMLNDLCSTRDYFIAVVEEEWNYAPQRNNLITDEQREAIFYMETGKHRIGSKYRKAMFVEYQDGEFHRKKEKPEWLGFLGPVLMAEIGQTIKIHFKNKASRNYSLHAHGVFYDKASEGSPYDDFSHPGKQDGDVVPPGGSHVYHWKVLERDAPVAGDPDCLTWMYSSHVDPIRDINSGLVGPLLTCKKGLSERDRRKSYDQEFVMFFSTIDENKSWYLDHNIDYYCWDSQDVDREDPDFIESNRMHSINGFVFGNLPGLNVCLNRKIRWHLIGGGVDIHTVNFHGQSLIYNHHRVASVTLYPAQFATVTMTARNKGKWLLKCQVHSHYTGGMMAFLNIEHCRRRVMPYSLTGKVRRYYIAAQETIWHYAPSNFDYFNSQNVTTNDSRSAFFFDRGSYNVGGSYKKVLYRAYTDSTFRRRKLRSKALNHLGLLGPVIKGEEGDLIKVVFRNQASRPYSIHPQGVNYNKFNEGAKYNDDTRDIARADDAVLPGRTKTYFWTMSRNMAPTDEDPPCLTRMYTSGVDSVRDTYSGLVGPILVCKRGALNPTARSDQSEFDREYILLFSVIDENLSWYINDSVNQFSSDPSKVDYNDPQFQQSNRMHSINGQVYGNLPGLYMCVGDQVSWHVLSLGSQKDVHSVYFYGHTLTEYGNRHAVVTVQPGSHHTLIMQADNEGDWAVVCRTNEHYTSGMTAIFHSHKCEDVYRRRKDLFSVDNVLESNHIPERLERTFYIAAEEIEWNYVPKGKDVTQGDNLNDPNHRGYNFARSDGQFIGTRYKKVVYRKYTDASFAVKVESQTDDYLGLLGPIIKAEVGDVIRVMFKNKASRPYSIHAEGVAYNKTFEGVTYMNASGVNGSVVESGDMFTYMWSVPPRSGPTEKDGACVTYMYYSAVNPARDTTSGLIGPLVICKKGILDRNGIRTDIKKDFALFFSIFDENLSWYFDENIEHFSEENISRTDPEFIQSNKMPAINGRSLGNLELELRKHDDVEWYLLAIGSEADIHSIHFHGHTFIQPKDRKHRMDTLGLFPGTTETVRMKTDNPGTWLIHCHVNDESMIGMDALYSVAGELRLARLN